MSFYESQMGHRFFNVQLPQLIDSIKALTDALARPVPVAALPVQPNPDFLSDLYHGEYEPATFKLSDAGHQRNQAVIAAHDALCATLPEESRPALEQYESVLAERNSVEMELAYESGFCTAVQMIVAGLSGPIHRPPDSETEAAS